MPLPLIIAHRGGSSHAPENTLAAFRVAVEAGADWVELDIQMTLDGKLVCLHDFSLERTTNAKSVYPERRTCAVSEYTLEEVKHLDAGGWFGEEFVGETIPTLQETIELVTSFARKPGLLVEIKDAPNYGDRIVEMIEELTRIACLFGFSGPD